MDYLLKLKYDRFAGEAILHIQVDFDEKRDRDKRRKHMLLEDCWKEELKKQYWFVWLRLNNGLVFLVLLIDILSVMVYSVIPMTLLFIYINKGVL